MMMVADLSAAHKANTACTNGDLKESNRLRLFLVEYGGCEPSANDCSCVNI